MEKGKNDESSQQSMHVRKFSKGMFLEMRSTKNNDLIRSSESLYPPLMTHVLMLDWVPPIFMIPLALFVLAVDII